MSDIPAQLSKVLSDRYRMDRLLGEGGMATVYLAEDVKHKRWVAVKVLRPELAATLGPERFVREIEIAAQLTHPHILPLFDSGQAGGFLYYVMPYIEGESLRDRLDRDGKLSVQEAIRLTDQVASALSYAHEQGVVHRDIKPENILLAADQAIVADFGIARAVQVAGGDKLTGTGLAIGTPAYMSPEQGLAEDDVDGRSDVYALGCVLYETISGRVPFHGSTPQALLAKHAAEAVPGLRESDPAIPVFVERAVAKALAKSPAERFQSPRAFADALTSGTVVARVGPRSWRKVAAAAVIVLAAVAWGATAILRDPAVERLAVLPPVNTLSTPDQEHIIQGMLNALISELGQAGITTIGSVQSMMRYQNTEKTVQEIAAEVGVDAVIESSVIWVGDSVVVDVRLTDGRTEEALWSHSYDEDARNVLALYREVTGAIADEIQLALTPQAEARLAGARTVNPETYEAYLRGMHYLNQFTPEGFEKGMAALNEAVDNDPADPLAYIGLAQGYNTLGHTPMSPPDAFQRANAAALTALRLDSLLPEAHLVLGSVKLQAEWDWAGAIRSIQRALELNPNLAEAHRFNGWYLYMLGQFEEAVAELQRAEELDPLVPLRPAEVGWMHWWEGRYDEALEGARRSLELNANFPPGLLLLGAMYAEKGMYEEAIAAHERARAASPDWGYGVAFTYALAGREAEARQEAERMAGEQHPNLWALAEVYAALGDKDEAFKWLDAAYDARHNWMPWVARAVTLAPLRDDPRFDELVRRLDLPR
jgi:serine/threonine protein kinase/tetratricopeptide (TPR) repeat protein